MSITIIKHLWYMSIINCIFLLKSYKNMLYLYWKLEAVLKLLKSDLHIAPKVFCYLIMVLLLLNMVYAEYMLYKVNHLFGGLETTMIIVALASLVSLIPIIMVLYMKKSGMILLFLIVIFNTLINAYKNNYDLSYLLYLLVPIILFGLLQIGGEKNSWKRMK